MMGHPNNESNDILVEYFAYNTWMSSTHLMIDKPVAADDTESPVQCLCHLCSIFNTSSVFILAQEI